MAIFDYYFCDCGGQTARQAKLKIPEMVQCICGTWPSWRERRGEPSDEQKALGIVEIPASISPSSYLLDWPLTDYAPLTDFVQLPANPGFETYPKESMPDPPSPVPIAYVGKLGDQEVVIPLKKVTFDPQVDSLITFVMTYECKECGASFSVSTLDGAPSISHKCPTDAFTFGRLVRAVKESSPAPNLIRRALDLEKS
jgi:hypothetical protein